MESEPNQAQGGALSEQEPSASGVQPTQSQGPEFKKVFSTTAKVILSIVLIGLGIGGVKALLSLIGAGLESSGPGRSDDFSTQYINSRDYYNDKADQALTAMPLSQWKRIIATDIRMHCIREGMTTGEVEKAVGKPETAKTATYSSPSDTGVVWEYTKQVGKAPCTRYDGDTCVAGGEPDIKKATLYFSPKGHLTYPYLSGPLKPDLGDHQSDCY